MIPTDPFYQPIASAHAIIGILIFLSGILQFALRKGTTLHKITGYVYFSSFIAIILTGAYIGSMIVVAIVLLGFYLCATGIRAAALKNNSFQLMDKIIIAFASIVVLCLFGIALFMFFKGNYIVAILSLFFFLLYAFIVGRDVLFYIFNKRVFPNDYGPFNWYVNHLTRLQFSFVTAVGAFTAVQNVFHNSLLNFTLPAIISFFVIRKSNSYFIRKAGIVPVKSK